MALFSQGSYSEFLGIVARETVQAFVEARLNVWTFVFVFAKQIILFSF